MLNIYLKINYFKLPIIQNVEILVHKALLINTG